jgi:hypothetical protein
VKPALVRAAVSSTPARRRAEPVDALHEGGGEGGRHRKLGVVGRRVVVARRPSALGIEAELPPASKRKRIVSSR